MPAVGRAHRDALHRLTQHGGEIGGCKAKARLARMQAQIVDEGGKRASILARPELLPAQRLSGRRQRVELIGERWFVAIAREQRGEDGFDLRPPVGDPRFIAETQHHLAQGTKARRRSRPA